MALILIPTAIDWFITNMGTWGGGGAFWCSSAGFLDFMLGFEYPLLLIAFGLILYTRRFGPPPQEQMVFDDFPMDEVDQHGSIINAHNGSR